MSERKADMLRQLDQQWAALWPLVERITPQNSDLPTPNGDWTVKDTLGHLSAATVNYPASVQRWLSGQSLTKAQLDALIEQRRQERRAHGLEQLQAELEQGHQAVKQVIETIDEGVLDRRARSSSGQETTIEERLRHVGDHYLEHAADLEAALAGRPPASA